MLLAPAGIFAQPVLRFRHLSLLEGLSQSTVNCVIQDRAGFIWIGTQDGLNRYDGYSFRIYKHIKGDKNSLPDNYVQSLYLDENGHLWVGTYGGGISDFDPITGRFTNYSNDPDDPRSLSNDVVMTISDDGNGSLWVGTSNGLNKMDLKTRKFTRYLSDPSDKASLSSNKVRCIFLDSKKELWIGTADNGINRYNAASGNFTRFTASSHPDSLSHNFVQTITESADRKLLIGTSGAGVNLFDPERKIFRKLKVGGQEDVHVNDVWSLFEDKDHVLWIGTYGSGLIGYDLKTGRSRKFVYDATDRNSLSNNVILCMFTDRQGFVWAGTLGGGVSYFDPGGAVFRNIYSKATDPNSLNENVVMCIYEDAGKGIYFGTYGGGLNYLDYRTGKYTFYQNDGKPGSLPSNIVRCIIKDSRGRIWVGTYDGGLSELRNGKFRTFLNDPADPNTISNNDVWCIREDAEGYLWLGTWGGGLNRFDPSTGKAISFRNNTSGVSISNDKVISLYIGQDGKIWAGTNGGGLNIYDKSTGTFRQYRHSDADTTSIASDRVRSIYADRTGRMWLGTDGGGLCKMNPDGSFLTINEKKGLPNNVVYGILEDSNNNLWLSTNNGLSRLHLKDLVTRNFDITDGLQGNEFNQGAYFKSSSGELYFGGVNGVTVFDPSKIRSNTYVPPVLLTSVKLFGKELQMDTAATYMRTLQLSYDQNFFSFEFTALDYTAPEKNMYACRMEGFDGGWIFLGNKRFVSYTNLDPGEYVFRVIASNNENHWNSEGYSLHIIIAPPFYKTKWFYILIAVILFLSVYLFIFIRTRNLRNAKKALEEEVYQRTKEVIQQKEIIEGKNKDITDSINYAQRIQRAIFPSGSGFKRSFPQSFIFYKPKDIVSGDFYWMERFGDEVFVAVVDCTGHGVPGAFMSIVGNNLLNQAVNELGISKPSLILNSMNKGLARLVKHEGELDINDGMDMALCAVNMKSGRLSFAGANNPVWIIRHNSDSVEEIRGDKKPIGSYEQSEASLFTNHEITLEKGDVFYLFSDGYADQFGGEQGKKMKKSALKQLLLSIKDHSMDEQGKAIEEHFFNWQGSYEQVDDVLIIGIRI